MSKFCFVFSTECDLLFTDETVDGLLKIFPASSVGQKTINVPDNQTCSFYFGDKLHAQYLGCAGTWNEIPAQSVNASLEVTPDWSTSRLQMKVRLQQWEKRRKKTKHPALEQRVLS